MHPSWPDVQRVCSKTDRSMQWGGLGAPWDPELYEACLSPLRLWLWRVRT